MTKKGKTLHMWADIDGKRYEDRIDLSQTTESKAILEWKDHLERGLGLWAKDGIKWEVED
jgi:hypothetical protein